jgi:hypothetical protein
VNLKSRVMLNRTVPIKRGADIDLTSYPSYVLLERMSGFNIWGGIKFLAMVLGLLIDAAELFFSFTKRWK